MISEITNTAQLRDNQFSVERILGILFVFFCLNPWTSFGLNGLQSQPWALISGTVFLCVLGKFRLPVDTLLLGITLLMGFAVALTLTETYELPILGRAIVNYATIFVVYVAFYNFLYRYGFPTKTALLIGMSWIFFAILETRFPNIIEFLSSSRTSSDRGLTSLAPEPTSFGIFMIFFAWVFIEAHTGRTILLKVIVFFGMLLTVLLVAKSLMSVVYIVYFLCCLFTGTIVSKRYDRRFLLAALVPCIILISVFFALSSMDQESRLVRLVSEARTHGLFALVLFDASISLRLEDAVLSFHGFYHNWAFPGGFDSYGDVKNLIRRDWGGVFWYPSDSIKVMSWLGTLFYELGLFGLLFYVIMIRAAIKQGRVKFWRLVALTGFLIGAIPLAFPLVPMLISLWIFKGQNTVLSESYDSIKY